MMSETLLVEALHFSMRVLFFNCTESGFSPGTVSCRSFPEHDVWDVIPPSYLFWSVASAWCVRHVDMQGLIFHIYVFHPVYVCISVGAWIHHSSDEASRKVDIQKLSELPDVESFIASLQGKVLRDNASRNEHSKSGFRLPRDIRRISKRNLTQRIGRHLPSQE